MHDTTPLPFAGCFARDADRPLVFLGLPDDAGSSFTRGPAAGPGRIRLAYDGRCFNASTELGVDLEASVSDHGDLTPGESREATRRLYRNAAERLLREGRTPFFAGGDHAVSIPVIEALAVLGQPVHVVQVDAHPDLYPAYHGDPWSHACVAARVLEMPHVAHVTQIGIRTMSAAQQDVAKRNRDRLTIMHAHEVAGAALQPRSVPQGALVYLTVDLDGFDPAYAPGVSHPVPGGLSSRQVLNHLHAARYRLVGMDVVELNPERDENDRTAILAARLLHEGMGLAATQRARP